MFVITDGTNYICPLSGGRFSLTSDPYLSLIFEAESDAVEWLEHRDGLASYGFEVVALKLF